jgi:hypothetical protein
MAGSGHAVRFTEQEVRNSEQAIRSIHQQKSGFCFAIA